MMDDSLTAELERLKAENERLPRAHGRTVSLKIQREGGRVGLWSRSLSHDVLLRSSGPRSLT